ncbi:transferase family-domain-containing protein [Trametes polyzona]|nr:transferase family-domain-containing protein [Trametes polyzona]
MAPLLEFLSRLRVLPEKHTRAGAHTVPLSILDHTTARFALTSAVWYYDPPSQESRVFSVESFTKSLRGTLNAYPQWAGKLQWIPYDPSRGQRQGRVCISYGLPTDPGVELIHTRSSRTLASLIPSTGVRMKDGAWFADNYPSGDLLYPTDLALHGGDQDGLPSVSVQLTHFACGGLSIAVRIVHPVADATSMLRFVKDWAAVHRALLDEQPPPSLAPVFNPSLLDNAASGDLRATAPDPALVRISDALPMLKYDWWASGAGCPEPMLASTKVPPELAGAELGPLGEPAPWDTWDITTPVSHLLVYFSPSEVQSIWEEASSQLPAGTRISRLDALLAHLWRLLVRARGLETSSELLHLGITVGARPRVSPPLPEAFIGSPIVLVTASRTGEALAAQGSSSLGMAAFAIREAVASLTPEALGAYLHDVAHEVNPQRFWRTFLGTRHSTTTSWLGLGVYDVDFGGGVLPRYVEAVMPNLDGCFSVLEAGPSSQGRGGLSGRGCWYKEPVCLSLHLSAEVALRMLRDPELRKY